MEKSLINKLLVVLCVYFSSIFITYSQGFGIYNLRCEYQENPIGLSEPLPRFSWEFYSAQNNFSQTAFQVKVASSPNLIDKPDVWNSKKIKANTSNIQFSQLVKAKKKIESFKTYYWRVTAWVNVNGKNHRIDSKINKFETGALSANDFTAKWITDKHNKDFEPAPMFRKIFRTSNKKIAQTRIYISGLGYYDMYVNNQKVSKNLLDPGYTTYNKRVLYSAYDVKNLLLNNQDNVIAVVLGHGWFNEQRVSWWSSNKAPWRARPQLICELHITYEDGTKEIICSDETWKTSTKGPYVFNNIYIGDYFDNRLNNFKWKNADFDDSDWERATITSAPAPIFEKQQMPPIKSTRTINPVSIKKLSPKKYVFDMGENFSGFCKIRLKGEKDTKVSIRYSELLGDNGEIDQGNIVNYYAATDEHPTLLKDIFILRGESDYEEFQPTFTYRGFQYVQIDSDNPIELNLNDVVGYFVHTNVTPVGNFSCSDTTLNKIWKATNQSYLSNLHSIPTDCPSREKNGWTADVYLAIDVALLNYDGLLFYEKWMKDLLDSQNDKGQIPGIAPTPGFGYEDRIGPVWDAVLFIVPNTVYNYYGDISIIENAYPAMEKYLEYLETRENENGLITFGYNDRNFWHTRTPTEYTSTMFYYLDNLLMSRFSKLLNKEASKYEKKAELLKNIINDTFYDPKTYTYSNGSQTAQALALQFGIAPKNDEQKIAEIIAQSVKDNFNHLDFGILGSISVPRMLTKFGYGDLVHKMAIKPTPPSWGYWVNTLKRTTLQESWIQNYRRAYGGSLNHVFLGDISAWMYNYLSGINFDQENPGFNKIILRPYFLTDLDWVYGEYNSVKGKIVSKWKRENKEIIYEVEIPANTTATVIVNDKEHIVGSGYYKYIINL